MTNKVRDLICSVAFLAFGVFMFVMASSIKPIMGKDLGSGYVPKFIAICIVLTSLVKLILALKAKHEDAASTNDDNKGGLLTIAALFIYAGLFETVGFIISTAIYLFFQILLLSDETNRKIPLFAGIAVVAPIAIYALFVYVIKMPLPRGLFGF